MKTITFSRIYQGRVTSAAFLSTSGKGKKATLEKSEVPGGWEKVLWAHHELFQDGVNYYLLALIACAGKGCPELLGIEERVAECWEAFRAKGENRRGMRESVARWLGVAAADLSLDQACEAVLAGNEAAPEVRRLAVQLLLGKAQGDSGIQQNGRGYWPRFCAPKARPTYDFSASTRAAEVSGLRLAEAVNAELEAAARQVLAAEVQLSWVVKVDADKPPRTGAEAKGRLAEAVSFFVESLSDPESAETRHGKWLREQADAAHELTGLKTTVEELSAEGLNIPVNRKAAPERTFATLLFKHCPSVFTQRLLAAVLGVPKAPKAVKKEAEQVSLDFAAFGDDPIKLARGTRGYVFPAFTALDAWDTNAEREPRWSELDIAMFKEALKVLNQFRLKTEERAAERAKTRRRLDFMTGKATKWDKDDGEAPSVLLETDERVRLMQRLEKDLLPPDITEEERAERQPFSFSEKALRGYDEVLEKWQRLVKPGEAFSVGRYERLKKCLDEHQAANSDSIGSATLFNYLIGGADGQQPVGDFWPLWQDPETSDILWDWGQKQELEEDMEHLRQPIRFTPADAVHSRRLFMASDLGGKSAAVHGDGAVDVSLAVQEAGIWQEKRLRLHYSAPRLARDHIAGDGKWLSPKLAAMMNLEAAPEQAFVECAVALMPERREGEEDRFLLNFPLSLDVTTLPGRAERAQKWLGQFNIADDTLMHLHWPGTRELSASKVVKDSTAWWERLEGFTCLGIDLGQRTAAAAARIEATRKAGAIDLAKPHWEIGEAGGQTWRARLSTLRMLRLPGEEAQVWDGQQMRTETSGSAGRCATPEERAEAQEIVTALGLEEEFHLRDEKADAARYFPVQNDHLLRAFKRAQGRLAKFQGWLCLLLENNDEPEKRQKSLKKVKDAITAPRQARFVDDGPENPVFLKLRELAAVDAPDWQGIEALLRTQIGLLRERLPQQLIRIASRVLPLRDGYWSWESEAGPDDRLTHRLQRHVFSEGESGHKPPKVRGQRGLSLPRIEQLVELRSRCQGLNKALRRPVGGKAEFGRPLQGQELPDPCPDLAEKLENMREQRVNQTAHLILAEALGLELTAPQTEKAERQRRDIHGEYRKVREPVDFIIIEDLNRYLTSQGRAPSENSRLMKWCHRQITEKLKQLCEPLGMPVLEVNAAYSSRFSSRSSVAGFRAVEVGAGDRHRQPWKKLLRAFDLKKNEASEEAKRAASFFSQVESMKTYSKHLDRPLTLLWPKAGGPIFVPITDDGGGRPMQADLNAAINIALRGIAAPDKVRLLHRLRAVPVDGKLLPKTENLREKALFGAKPQAFEPIGAEFGKVTRGGTNFFLDAARQAEFDHGGHPRLPGQPVATGKGLWKKVKDAAWQRCQEINHRRVEAARRKSEGRDRLP